VEFVYEKTMWSAYETLDFNYVGSIGNLKPYFDDPIAKNWKDTSAYRLGITQEMDRYTFMAGMVYDQTPVPDESLSFELPDSDALSLSLGMRYQYSKTINIGMSGLYSMRDTRKVSNDALNGEFSNSDVLILSMGLGYKF
jgi:long-chain fatty acid transport protein